MKIDRKWSNWMKTGRKVVNNNRWSKLVSTLVKTERKCSQESENWMRVGCKWFIRVSKMVENDQKWSEIRLEGG
jgi:hypothetical protein